MGVNIPAGISWVDAKTKKHVACRVRQVIATYVESKLMHGIFTDGNQEPIIVDSDWVNENHPVPGDYVVYIPADNTMAVMDSRTYLRTHVLGKNTDGGSHG